MKNQVLLILLNALFFWTSMFVNINIAEGRVLGVSGNTQSVIFPNCNALWSRTDIALSEYKDWVIEQSAGVTADVVYMKDLPDVRDAIGVHFKSNAGVHKRPQIVLKSAALSSRNFDSIKSISLVHKVDYGGQIRVVLRSYDGNTFSSNKPILMRNRQWSEVRRTNALKAVIFHGKPRNKKAPFKPKPPFSIDHIRLGLPAGDKGEGVIRISNIGIFGQSSLISSNSSKSPYEEWLRDNCNYQGSENIDVNLELPPTMKPLNAGSRVPIRVNTQLYRSDTVSITVSVNRFGADRVVLLDKILPKSGSDIFSTSFEHEFESPGIYAVVVALFGANGKLLTRMSQRVMVWDPPGNTYKDNLPEFFGMMYHDRFPETRQKDLELMAEAGVKIVRFPFRWSDIQVKRDRYVWSKYDDIMRSIDTGGFIAQPMVFYTPAWAARNLKISKYADIAKKRPQWVVPRDPQEVAEFFGNAAKRYKKQPVIWEIYNEPTESQHWIGGNVEDYVKIVKSISREVRKATPDAGLINGGIGVVSAQDKKFAPYLAKNIDGVIDNFSIHAYGGPEIVAENIEYAQAILQGTASNIGIWLNETGYLVDPNDPTGELRRSSVLVKTMVVSRFMGVENFSWFIFRTYASNADLATYNYAITASDGSVRQPILAYANAVRWLARSKPDQKVKIGQSIRGYEFMIGTKKVLVTWLEDEYGEEIFQPPLRDGVAISGVYDMFGGVVNVSGDEVTIKQKHYPLFLVYERDSDDESGEAINKWDIK